MYTVSIIILTVVFIGIAIFVAVASYTWRETRSMSMLEQWASENSFQLLSTSRSHFTLGTPFWAASSKSQTVYRITVRDRQGKTLSGYALCGSWVLGLRADRVEIKWDSDKSVSG